MTAASLLDHWPRKILALLIAIVIWFLANNSMTMTKIVHNVPVRIINLPEGKVVEEMQINGLLNRRVALTLTGLESVLDELTATDLEVVIDAQNTPEQWVSSISKRNLICLNQKIDLAKALHRVDPLEIILKKCPRITERIPISVKSIAGKVPQGYQFLDIFPHQLYFTATGPEEAIRRLKMKGISLSFNLSKLSQADLDALWTKKGGDEVSFLVPQAWKKISLPELSDVPFELDDPQAESLCITFLRQELIPIQISIPVTIFFPMKLSKSINPDTHVLAVNDLIVKKNGIKTIAIPLFAFGVDHAFLETVQDNLQIILTPNEKTTFCWSAQFSFAQELESSYVSKMLTQMHDEKMNEPSFSRAQENLLRSRFRNFMARFRLYTEKENKLSLNIELQGKKIVVTQKT